MTWSGVFLRSTLSHGIIQKALNLVLMTGTGPEVYITTMATVLSGSYDYFEETLNQLNSLKLKFHLGENVSDFCAEILVDDE